VKVRVRDGKQWSDTGSVTFDGVRILDAPLRDLTVRIERDADRPGLVLSVRDVSIRPPEPLPNDEARWRAAGYDRSGQPLRIELLE
jgi:hypothetical protein